jgi:predicted ATP-dependent protease
MKIKKARLREIVQSVVQEAAKEGRIQKVYRSSYRKMIQKASTGGNKNTPPFTTKASKPGKSGPAGGDT